MRPLIYGVAALIGLALVPAANAAEVHKQKFAQWGDPLTPPQSRTDCIGFFITDIPFTGKQFKTCSEWRTQWRHIEVQAYLVVDRPDGALSDVVKNAIAQCVGIAIGTGLAAAYIPPGANIPASVAAAKVAFGTCLSTKASDVANQYSIRVDTDTYWTDWG